VRLRRSAALVVAFEGDAAVGSLFVRGVRAVLSPLALDLLAALGDWRDPEALFPRAAPRAAVAAELLGLMDLGFVVVAGSPAAADDARYRDGFRWGAAAGYYHFGIKDTDYGGPAAAYQWLSHQVATEPQVPLFTPNDGLDPTVALPPPPPAGFAELAARRRSRRSFDPARPMPLAALADCLFSALAIVAFGETGVPGEEPLPLTTTPSGGARNPFEAFVAVRAVEGLEPGVYHYAGLDHSLGRVRAGRPDLAALLGNQAWFADAGAVILLVAVFERCMWKYPHPTGFRVVLLEAGHIAQNLLLAATERGLAATPTCAISDRTAEALCGLDRLAHAAVHSVALGIWSGAPADVDLTRVRPNLRLRW
jgi:SagB-type dehydrogenase family enzyme